MARIVSGVPQAPEWDGGAILRGYEKGAKFRLAEAENARQEQELTLKMMSALSEMQLMKAKTLKLQQEKANMGDVQAMMSLAQLAKAGSLDPDQAMVESMIQMRSGIQDPKALVILDRAIAQTTGAMKDAKERTALEGEIKRGATGGWLDEAKFRNDLAAGSAPHVLLGEAHKAEAAHTAKGVAKTEADQAIKQGQALIDTTPPGLKRRKAMIRMQAYAQDLEGQQKPGSAQDFMAALRNDLLETDEEMLLRKQQQLGPMSPAPGLQGMTTGQRTSELEKGTGFLGLSSPKIPKFTGGTHATVKRGQAGAVKAPPPDAIRSAISALVEEVKDPVELARALQAQGVPLTPEVQQLAREALSARRTNAQAAAGADR